MISNAQKTLLHVAKDQLQLDEDTYRALLQAEAGVTSSNELDNQGLDRVLRRFKKLGFVNTAYRPRRSTPTAGALRTDEQLTLIEANYRMLGWDSEAQKLAFNKRCCSRSWPQTRGEATKIVIGQERYAATVLEKHSSIGRDDILRSRATLDEALAASLSHPSADASILQRAHTLLAARAARHPSRY